jgi:hypothetical protein
MNELEKLRVLLPHWIKHNRGHAEECNKWAVLAATEKNATEVASNLQAAFAAMEEVSMHLEKALAAAGGAAAESAHKHHHHH